MKECTPILFFATLIILGLFSCKKSSSSSQTCTLASITDSTTSVQSVKQFVYDNSNRVVLINTTGKNAGDKTYAYIGNMIIINSTNSVGVTTEIDSIVLNGFNEIQSYVNYYPLTDTTESGVYYYNTAGIALSSTESVNGIIKDTSNYNTTNGDLNYEIVQGQTVPIQNYTYYTQNIVSEDPTNIKQLLYYGAYYYKNVHMLKEFYSVGVFYNSYEYTFSNNRIAQAAEKEWVSGSPDTVTHILQYAYSCK